MQTHKQLIIFFLELLLLSTLTKSMENNPNSHDCCSSQVCSNGEPVTRYVEFPFLIKNKSSLPKFCGYPGFDLLCNEHAKLLINLPNSGVYTVEEIDYVNQKLWLNDPDNCLPRRVLSLNHSNSNFAGKSPFNLVYDDQVYRFFNCSDEFFNNSDHKIRPIGCLSGLNYGVIAISSEKIKGNSSLCVEIGPVKVPVRKRLKEVQYFSGDLMDDIMIAWDEPNECGECYRRNGSCRFKSNFSLEIGCFNLPRQGLSREAMFAITLAFATPLLLVTLCILYFTIKAIYLRRRANNARLTRVILTSAVTPQPEGVIHGLHHSIIESYPKIILGESRRLPKEEDKHCPICLGEYLAMEILRTIPDCSHCFHAHCIDEWLMLNASCPVCRNSPCLTPENNAS